jgi:DNA (cytosine-5)-methyltransferase 1
MRHGSLFSGIGGFDLAAEWMDWTNVFHCEWNEFGQRVLKHHFPKSKSYGDITQTDFTIHRGDIDILTGGFPCQPYSTAGKRLGKDDERHLWPEMLRVIRETSPRYVVGENVRGLTNWNGGLVFDEVQADLEALGYEVLPFILPACAVGAPHRRDRVWFIANSHGATTEDNGRADVKKKVEIWREDESDVSGKFCSDGNAPDTVLSRSKERTESERNGPEGREASHGSTEQSPSPARRALHSNWANFPTTEPTVRMRDDGLPAQLDGITFSKWRAESVKAYGNAIVPQVALEIFKAIQQYENIQKSIR